MGGGKVKGTKKVTLNTKSTTMSTEVAGFDWTSSSSATELPAIIEERQTLNREVGSPQPFVGLKNLGATCYMNAVLQTLVTTPELRDFLLSWKLDPKQQHSKNVAYQLQLLFARMQRADVFSHVNPDLLMKSFGMGADAHRQQHDCQELIRVLFGVVTQCTALAKAEDIVAKHYTGKFNDYRECLSCGERSSSETPFQDITVALSAMEIFTAEATDGAPEAPTKKGYSLLESLQAYSAPDIIEGAHCEACDQRMGLKKGEELSELPDILSLQLRRFGYDMTTGRREKCCDDFELPLNVDLTSALSPVAAEKANSEGIDLNYAIHSIICHRGTAYHGHYYSFVQTEPGRWIKFDDDEVTEADPLEVVEYLDPCRWRELQHERLEAEQAARREKLEKVNAEKDEADKKATEKEVATAAESRDQDAKPDEKKTVSQDEVGPSNVAAADTDEMLFSGNLFDAPADAPEAALFGPSEGTGCSHTHVPKPSGQSYYVVYRRCRMRSQLSVDGAGQEEKEEEGLGLPKVVPVPADEMSANLTAALEEEVALMRSKRARLAEISAINVAAIHHPLSGDNSKYWVECTTLDTTISQLAIMLVEQHPQLVETFPGGSYEATWRLRKFTGSLLGDSYEGSQTLRELGFTAEAPFPHLGVEFGTAPFRQCKNADVILDLQVWQPPPVAKIDVEKDANVAALAALNGEQGAITAAIDETKDADEVTTTAVAVKAAAAAATGMPYKAFKPHTERFTVYADCTVKELYCKIAHSVLGVTSVNQVGITLNRHGDPVNPFEPKCFDALSGTFIQPPPSAQIEEGKAHKYAPRGLDWDKPMQTFGFTPMESLFVEPITDFEETQEKKEVELRAPDFITKSNYVDIHYTIQTDTDGLAGGSDPEPQEVAISLDGREHLFFLKKLLCSKANEQQAALVASGKGVAGKAPMAPNNTQILLSGSVQEIQGLQVVKMKTMAMGTGKVTVKLVEGPPLKRDEFYCEIFEAQEGQFLDPVKFQKRFIANSKTTPACIVTMYRDILNQRHVDDGDSSGQQGDRRNGDDLAALMKLPAHNFRVRLMDANRKKSLGNPILKPTIRQSWREGHAADGIRVVVQLLSKDPAFVPQGEGLALTKDSLILRSARWHSEVPDSEAGCMTTDTQEFIIGKYTTALATKLRLSTISGVPVEHLQVARAKYYQTQTQDSVWKLYWEHFDLPKNQQKDIGFPPFKFEHDEFILYRDRRETWTFISQETIDKFSAKKNSAGGSSSGGGKKNEKEGASAQEVGISIRSIWDEEELDAAPTQDIITTTPTETENAQGGKERADVKSDVEEDATVAGAGGSGGSITLNQDPYMELLHGTLDSSCAICMDDFSEGESVTVLNCHHIYHHDCLHTWVEQQPVCPNPTCKEPVV